jgi:hypothetical protein
MTDIMLDLGGSMMSLIAPAIEVIRGMLYSRRVFHPLSLAIRGVPFPPVLLPARWNRLCRAVITLIDNRNGPALSAKEFLPGKFFFRVICVFLNCFFFPCNLRFFFTITCVLTISLRGCFICSFLCFFVDFVEVRPRVVTVTEISNDDAVAPAEAVAEEGAAPHRNDVDENSAS